MPDPSRESPLGSLSSVDAHRGGRSSHLLVIGPPGAGTGTQAEILSDYLGMPHVSAGVLLREASGAGSPLGHIAARFVAHGLLVPDKLVLRLRLRESPRVHVEYDRSYRLPPRWRPSYSPSSESARHDDGVGSDPRCRPPPSQRLGCTRARLVGRGRPGDTEAVIGRRLSAYHRFTVPMVAWMAQRRPVATIDGDRSVTEVSADLARRLDRELAERFR